MKAWVTFFVAAACIAYGASSINFGGPKTDSPTHVVAVFLDGYNHGDFRQACSMQKPKAQPMVACEQFYVVNTAQSLLFTGEWGGYKVVPHSAKVWRQAYRGRTVELATVRFVYGPQGGKLTAHLRLTKHGWRIWAIR